MDGETARDILEEELGQFNIPNSSQQVIKYWDAFVDKDIALRMEYTRLSYLRFLQMRYAGLVDTAIGTDRFFYSQKFKHVTTLYQQVETQIKSLDPNYGATMTGSFTPTPTMVDRIEDLVNEGIYFGGAYYADNTSKP